MTEKDSKRRILRTLDEKIRPEHTALIVVDVQNDFCHSDGAYVKRGNDVSLIQAMVPRLDRTIRAAREAGVPVIFLRIVQSEDTNSDAWEALESDDGPRLVEENTWGADYFDPIRPLPGEREIIKRRHSGFNRTPLDLYLRSQGIKTVVIGGVASNVCVEATAREAADNDYYVVLLEDGCASAKANLHEDAVYTIRRYIGYVHPCQEVIDVWRPAQGEKSESRPADPVAVSAR
jgi:ureidoacrylate peracid hydrolase